MRRRPSPTRILSRSRLVEQTCGVRSQAGGEPLEAGVAVRLGQLVGARPGEGEDAAWIREGDGGASANPVEVAHSAVPVVADRNRPAVLSRDAPHGDGIVADVDRNEVDAATKVGRDLV